MSHTSFANTTTLLTGAAGFIGSHLAERIMNEGGKVIGVDNFVSGQRKHVEMLQEKFGEKFKFVEVDVSEGDSIATLQNDSEYGNDNQPLDFILHFASPASPPR